MDEVKNAPAARPQTSTVVLAADEQLWQVARLFRKAEAFDVLADLLADINSIDAELKQIERRGAGKASAMRAQLLAERSAIERAIGRHIGRQR